ncbi:MAG: NADH-quinone oxidoreductase subunit N [Acidimicrobiia bacterium]|nr:NADH-quinone oxidoreductase subunit N [Acidimicrobiia bacterium]
MLAIVIQKSPMIDWHAFAPEVVIIIGALTILIADLFLKKRSSWKTSNIAALTFLVALIPVITLAIDGTNRSMFGGSYIVDNQALAFKAFFLVGAYISVLLSGDYIREGDYFQAEFWFLLTMSVLGMSTLSSSRDLISLFVSIETVTIPTFVLASWRKRDLKSNEAGIKYYLIGVMSSAIMLYGMSFVVGFVGSTKFVDIQKYFYGNNIPILAHLAVIFTVIGFAFKISSVPFHQWTPDVYEGAPTPVTAFLSVLSKGAGFVGILALGQYAFLNEREIWMPILSVMVVASLIIGNFAALKQTNIVRMLAYSSIAQGGFILLPIALLGYGDNSKTSTLGTNEFFNSAVQSTYIYLAIYLFANLGAFASIIAISRRINSGDIAKYNGLGRREPFLSLMLTIFLFSLAGVPPLAGWFAKFVMFKAALEINSVASITLAIVAAVTSVVAFTYYAGIIKRMWLEDPAELDLFDQPETSEGSLLLADKKSTVVITPALRVAIVLCAGVTILLGFFPGIIARVGELIVLVK